jgi:hypothetical protein
MTDSNDLDPETIKAKRIIVGALVGLIILPVVFINCATGSKMEGEIIYNGTVSSGFDSVCLGKMNSIIYATCDTGEKQQGFTKYTISYRKVYGQSIFSPFRPEIDILNDSLFLIGMKNNNLYRSTLGIESSDELDRNYSFPKMKMSEFHYFTPKDTLYLPDVIIDMNNPTL